MTAALGTNAARVAALDWTGIAAGLDARGVAAMGPLLSAGECGMLSAMYSEDARFRSRVVMRRHGFGEGEYKYFSAPLPDPVASLRPALYRQLVPVANRWAEALGQAGFPNDHAAFLSACHAAGQTKPTPLLLRYGAGDYNCLHQDVYGPDVFPLQVVILLSRPEADFSGGEFLVVEQRPRQQSRAEVVTLRQGEAAVFAVRERPVMGTRGIYRTALRHGVSRVHAGERFTLGIIFHDAA